MVTFRKDTHEYFINNTKAIGVNELLNHFGIGLVDHIPERYLEPARIFGTAGHLMCQYYFMGCLNEKTLDPKLQPYLIGLKKLCKDHEIIPIDIEKPICFETLLVAGTPDLVCLFDGVKSVLDYKFVKKVQKSSHLSTGGYRYLVNSIVKEPEELVRQVKIIHMQPEISKVVDVDNDVEDQFESLVMAYHTVRMYK